MKLRNKKTREVVVEVNKIGLVWNKYGMPAEIGQYDSIAELNEEWEDYAPKEPLIKDEKIRKAVRAWAEACGADDADIVRHYGTGRWIGLRYENPNTGWVCKLEVEGFGSDNRLGYEKVYTIEELCGEEEE